MDDLIEVQTMDGTLYSYTVPVPSPASEPFRSMNYPAAELDDRLLNDRFWAEIMARREELPWKKAYRSFKVVEGARQVVEVSWRIW